LKQYSSPLKQNQPKIKDKFESENQEYQQLLQNEDYINFNAKNRSGKIIKFFNVLLEKNKIRKYGSTTIIKEPKI